MLILCDFDGTITDGDVTNLLWDHFGIPGWRELLLPPYRAGAVSTLELMDQGWREIQAPQSELLSFAHEHITLRDGFLEFVAACKRRGWPMHVISNGLDWYLRAFLPSDIPFTSYTAVLEDGWRVRMPTAVDLPAGRDFKVHVMHALRLAHPGHEAVFIGDGRNDLPVSRVADRAFAVRGSSLSRLCREAGVPAEEFESFSTVSEALATPMPQ